MAVEFWTYHAINDESLRKQAIQKIDDLELILHVVENLHSNGYSLYVENLSGKYADGATKAGSDRVTYLLTVDSIEELMKTRIYAIFQKEISNLLFHHFREGKVNDKTLSKWQQTPVPDVECISCATEGWTELVLRLGSKHP